MIRFNSMMTKNKESARFLHEFRSMFGISEDVVEAALVGVRDSVFVIVCESILVVNVDVA